MKPNFRTVIAAAGILFTISAYAGAQDRRETTDPNEFLAKHEAELEQAGQSRKLYLLLAMAPAALAANKIEKARSYADQLFAMGEAMQAMPGFGPSMLADSTHVGHMVLGQIAFLNGDIKGAKENLVAAGKVPGSPVLNSFGPEMLLAKELIGKGERETVLAYLDLCGSFWQNERGRLESWKQTINEGQEPDFGANNGRVFRIWQFVK